jgi:hypothetical protein
VAAYKKSGSVLGEGDMCAAYWLNYYFCLPLNTCGVVPTLPIHPWFVAATEEYLVPDIKKTDKAWLVADIERELRAAVPGHRRQCSGCLIGIPSAVYPKLFAIEFSVTFGTMTVTFDPNYESEVREAVEALDVVATPTSQKGRADQTPISASPMKAKDVEINIDIVS